MDRVEGSSAPTIERRPDHGLPVYDAGAAAGSGYFSVNGVHHAANEYINVSASQLDNVQLPRAQTPGSELSGARVRRRQLGRWIRSF